MSVVSSNTFIGNHHSMVCFSLSGNGSHISGASTELESGSKLCIPIFLSVLGASPSKPPSTMSLISSDMS